MEQEDQMKDAIRLIESSFPADMFFSDFGSDSEHAQIPQLEEGDLEKMLGTVILFLSPDGVLNAEKIKTIMSMEPFSSYRDLSQTLLGQMGYPL